MRGICALNPMSGTKSLAKISKSLRRAKRKTLVIGSDVLSHKRSENIARLCALIEATTDFSLVVVPQNVNTVGVSLICDLDQDEKISNVVGYNAHGDFVIGSMGECDMVLPALNSQEGTFVSLNYQLLSTNVAIAFEGYCLNDIAQEFGLKAENTIDYTVQLPTQKGFKRVEFDALGNFYGSLGEDNRGYMLEDGRCCQRWSDWKLLMICRSLTEPLFIDAILSINLIAIPHVQRSLKRIIHFADQHNSQQQHEFPMETVLSLKEAVISKHLFSMKHSKGRLL